MECKIIFLLLLSISYAKEYKYFGSGSRYKRAPVMEGSATQISKVPYYASVVEWDREHLKYWPSCGAAIISENWLLSATHCFYASNWNKFKIRTGTDTFFTKRDTTDNIYEIANITYADGFEYNDVINYNDICLVKTKTPMQLLKDIQWPIKLPPPNCDPESGTKIIVVGFGLQTASASKRKTYLPHKLLFGKVKIMNRNTCAAKYPRFLISKKIICATSRKQETGNGDSGGPAVVNSQLVGIISTGGRGLTDAPGVYTAVNQYMDWITEKTGIQSDEPTGSYCCINTFNK